MSIIHSFVPYAYTLKEHTDTPTTPGAGHSSASLFSAPPQSSGSGDSVTLSAEAQAYLASLNATNASASEHTGFSLNERQKAQIAAILAHYKDAPYTQESYDAIQLELAQSGLSPDQLSLQEKVASFNSTQSLMDALNQIEGEESSLSDLFAQPVDEQQANDYMKSILMQWQSLMTPNAS